MDILFTKLLSKIDALLSVNKNIDNHPLSETGEKYKISGSLKNRQIRWHNYVKKIKVNKQKLENTLPNFKSDSLASRKLISSDLAFWRSLGRCLSDGGDPIWSSLYPQVDKILNEIYVLVYDIDIKYQLGPHMSREDKFQKNKPIYKEYMIAEPGPKDKLN